MASPTEPQPAGKDAAATEVLYRSLFDSIDQGFCIIEMCFDDSGRPIDYRFLEVNAMFEKQTGLIGAPGRSMRELVPEHESHWFDIYGRVATSGQPIRFEQPAAALGRWFDVYAFRVGEPALRRVGVLFSDIGARKATERALHHSQQQLATIIDAAPLGIYVVDQHFTIRHVNPAGLPVFSGLANVVGRDLCDVFRALWAGNRADELIEHFRKTLATGEDYVEPESVQVRKDNGKTEHFAWWITRVVLPGGSPGVVCYFRDIANEVATRRTLEEADRKKDEFIATLSHELRNPLSSIANAAEMLGTPELDAAGRQWAAQVVQRQAVAMGMLLEDLLDISRLTLGRLVMKKQPVTLATVIESALEATRPMIELAKHTLAITMPPATVAVDGDPLRLSQVISNLLSNASKYTDPGGMIKLDVDVLPTEVVVCVKDNGIGMDAASLEHIFEMFSQADGMSERGGGLGIGLALVRGIVELHGGWVRAKSEGLGRGSTFSIGLPRVAGGAHDAAHNTSGVPRPGAIAPQRILVVDDNTDAAEALSNVLELYGHDTRFATSGPQALAELEHFKPQIAVLDIGMPHMNGYEVARRIRATDEGQRMLLFAATGWGQEKDKAMAKEAGFDRHLTKPVAVEKLLALIEEASRTQG